MSTIDIITALGGPAEVGRALGIRSQAVSLWLRRGKIPLDRVPALLQLAGELGLEMTARDIRSDFDWQAVCCG